MTLKAVQQVDGHAALDDVQGALLDVAADVATAVLHGKANACSIEPSARTNVLQWQFSTLLVNVERGRQEVMKGYGTHP
jgi:hypothetical protein